MFRYDLNSLSPETFAKLCNALLAETVSDKVRPFDTTGADAGRDGDYTGPGKDDYAELSGYWIFKYKHHDVSRLGVKEARKAIRRGVARELAEVFAAGRRHPDIYILITNVPFSGTLTSGTHDWFSREVERYRLSHAEVWDYTKLEALIDAHYEIQRSFFPDLTYSTAFFKQITDRLSSSVFWEGFETLLNTATPGTVVFQTRADLEKAKDLLWDLYESLGVVVSVFSTISNYVYSWPEFTDMVGIAVQNPKYKITLGEHHWIEQEGGGGGGGSRNIWTVLRGLAARGETGHRRPRGHEGMRSCST